MNDVRFLIDLTTSREYKGQNPVGIVRTEREIAKAFLNRKVDLDFFWFNAKTGNLTPISRREAIEIVCGADEIASYLPDAAVATQEIPFKTGNKTEFEAFLRSVKAKMLARKKSSSNPPSTAIAHDKIEIFDNDVIISAGLLWDGNYLDILYDIKKHTKVFVVQVVYDIVPILMPEFCVPGMNVRFPRFILDAAWTADAIYCISDSTLTDLDHYLSDHKLPHPQLKRITLGADLAKKPASGSAGLRADLKPGGFVVYVSTIEPRKNHIMLFHVWRTIFQRDPDNLLTLVIVGKHGWNASDLINTIFAADHLYPDYIKIWTEVSDADLDWLYLNSKFSVYPSLYEGWGLPVAESLVRGKFCIASSTSSLPEVASGLAELIDPLDLPAWTKAIHHYMTEDEDVQAKERAIREGYKPVLWDDAMQEFVTSVLAVTGPLAEPVAASGEVS